MILTQKKIDEMFLKLAKAQKEEAKKKGDNRFENMSLEAITELHKEVLKQMGWELKGLPH